MIVNICGASGQGKSQVLSYLKEEGYQVESLLPEPVRPKNTEEFLNHQNDLFLYRDQVIKEHNKAKTQTPLIIESSFIDMFVYSILVVGISFDHKEWIDQYYEMCVKAQRSVDLMINLPLNSIEDTSLPYSTANSFNVLVENYQKEVEDHCNIVSIDVESDGIHSEEYIEKVCNEVNGVIESHDERIRRNS